jgi:predicted ester cyclase/ubiquinone/menaquinone biosynthesis C-methylase UbiE
MQGMVEVSSDVIHRFVDEVMNGSAHEGPDIPVSLLEPFATVSPDGSILPGFRRKLAELRTSFPDIQFTVQDLFWNGATVRALLTSQGTHEAEFRGVAPSGGPVSLHTAIEFALDGHKIARARFQPVQPGLRQQVLEQWERTQPWYKGYAGGDWEREGKRQFDWLMTHGLQPHHRLLDVGCGTLRGGVKFIPYLEPGHYWGVDARAEAIEGGHEAIREYHLEDYHPHLVHREDSDFTALEQSFDYVWAYSVFTEIPLNSILRCLMTIEKVLLPGGKLHATYWENPDGKRNLDPIKRFAGFYTYLDSYPYHYDFQTFQWLCEGTRLSVKNLGPWWGDGPQSIMVFEKHA